MKVEVTSTSTSKSRSVSRGGSCWCTDAFSGLAASCKDVSTLKPQKPS